VGAVPVPPVPPVVPVPAPVPADSGSVPIQPPLVFESVGAVMASDAVLVWRMVPPRLSMSPPVLASWTLWPSRVPVFSSRPAAVTTRLPALAPMLPALRTPRPASVPIKVIFLAYMPPRAETSSAKVGALPVPATGVIRAWSTLIWLAPVTTFRSVA
jgi:hypothetical protein